MLLLQILETNQDWGTDVYPYSKHLEPEFVLKQLLISMASSAIAENIFSFSLSSSCTVTN